MAKKRTIFRSQAARILDEEVRKGAVNMGTHFLARLGGAEDPDDGDAKRLGSPAHVKQVRWPISAERLWVVLGRKGLVRVDAVEPDSEDVHGFVSGERGPIREGALLKWGGGVVCSCTFNKAA